MKIDRSGDIEDVVDVHRTVDALRLACFENDLASDAEEVWRRILGVDGHISPQPAESSPQRFLRQFFRLRTVPPLEELDQPEIQIPDLVFRAGGVGIEDVEQVVARDHVRLAYKSPCMTNPAQ